jgi:hypothetical protein
LYNSLRIEERYCIGFEVLEFDSTGNGSLLGDILRKNEVFKKNLALKENLGQVLLWKQSG